MPVFRNRSILWTIGLFLGVQLVGLGLAQDRAKSPKRRARRPVFDAQEVDRIFFNDLYAELVGDRPANISIASTPTTAGPATSGDGGAASSAGATGNWAQLISATTIEDEIKALKMQVDKDVTTISDFAGRGYKVCRTHFSSLAALFNVIHEYDGDVRWKKQARAARDLFPARRETRRSARRRSTTKQNSASKTYRIW